MYCIGEGNLLKAMLKSLLACAVDRRDIFAFGLLSPSCPLRCPLLRGRVSAMWLRAHDTLGQPITSQFPSHSSH